MARATAAHATRSPRNFGKTIPSLIAPARCPARPTRWSPLATDGGDSICTTRSIAPMSMPSSRADVAASARMRPSFSRSSTSVRVSRPGQRLAGQIVQRGGQTLGQSAIVHEYERGRMRPNQLEQPRMNRRPDGAIGTARTIRTTSFLYRELDAQVDALGFRGIDDGDG